MWHKVHLLVQINLASLELPSQKDANMVRRQLAIEKNVIFDRINRLIRCMIDCKVSDGDAISVRSGLELARAIAANAWEDHPAQLQQVSGLGPVTMRKFLSYGIRSIQDLAGQSFVDIERIASRNPPFGKNMLKSLQDFPRLQMTPEIVSRNGRSYTRFEDAVRVAINVKLHYTNTKVPTWGGKLPVVTFMAETTDGRLANFWRGSIKKLSEVNDFELRFFVALSAPGEKITCYFSCEEIVGTQVTKLLSPDVPSNAFQGLPRCRGATALGSDLHQRPDDGIIDGDLADEDMLDVLGTANIDEPQHVNSQPRSEGLLEEFEVEFPDIEDVVDTMMDHIDEEKTPTAPIQMANGKWKCNHQCAGGAPTKNGKQCSHRCCHEGLDRPRPAPRKKEKNAVHKIRSIPEDMTTIRSMSEASQRTVKPNERKTQPKRQLSESSATKNRAAVKKPRTQARFNDDDIKCIDLSAVTDDEEKSKMYIPKGPADLKKAQKKLTDLHDRIEPHGESSSRPTKPGRTLGFNGKALKHPEENAHADFDGDILGDDDEDLPELEYLLRSAEDSQALEASQVLANDDALRSTAPNTHGKNKDSGHWPSLSFITAAASEKASYHPNRSRQSKPNSDPALSQEETVPKIQSHNDLTADMSAPMNLTSELEGSLSDTDLASSILNTADRTIEPLLLDSEISDSLTTIHIPLTPLPNALATPLPGEPPWVGEYNQDLINMLRGTVEFVD